jgi:hypothetical protein
MVRTWFSLVGNIATCETCGHQFTIGEIKEPE